MAKVRIYFWSEVKVRTMNLTKAKDDNTNLRGETGIFAMTKIQNLKTTIMCCSQKKK